jgi:predicted nucleic acid-binding Zn ribbon protein
MKLPANVRVGEGSSQYIRWLESGRCSELPKKRSPAPGRFTMSLSEVKRAVLRYCECRFHICFPNPGETGRVADQPSKSNLQHKQLKAKSEVRSQKSEVRGRRSEVGSRRFAGANSTAGVREREDANRTREAGDSVLVKTERSERDLTTEAALRVDCGVPTYIYETTDPAKPTRNFEVKQSVHDEPLQRDPETGEAARRVISAGYSILIRGKSVGPSVGSVG